MSIAMAMPPVQSVWSSVTVRQFGRALCFAGCALAVGCLLYGIETGFLRSRHRFIENPSDEIMRALGLAHFCIGWLFLATSPRIRNGRTISRILIAGGLGLAACWFFAAYDAWRHPLGIALFYAYFLSHEVRDEMQLFQASGEASNQAAHIHWRRGAATAVAVGMIGLLFLAFALHPPAGKKAEALREWPTVILPAAVTAILATAAVLFWRCWRQGLLLFGDARSLVTANRPLLVVYGILVLVVLSIPVVGSFAFNTIILIHVGAWLAFACSRRCPAPRTWSQWWRQTPAGVVTLHVMLAAFFLGLMAARVHLWDRTGWICSAMAGSSFPYWSLMHISLALVRLR